MLSNENKQSSTIKQNPNTIAGPAIQPALQEKQLLPTVQSMKQILPSVSEEISIRYNYILTDIQSRLRHSSGYGY